MYAKKTHENEHVVVSLFLFETKVVILHSCMHTEYKIYLNLHFKMEYGKYNLYPSFQLKN